MCVFRAVRRREIRLWLRRLLKDHHSLHFLMVNEVIDAFAARGVCASRWKDEKGALSLKVCASTRSFAAALRLMARSLACQRGCLWLPRYPTLIVTFFDYQSRTTRQATSELVERSRGVRTLRPCGEGGYSARAAAAERLGARLWHCGRDSRL